MQNSESWFTELLEKHNSKSIHSKIVWLLATEIFKVNNEFSSPFHVWDFQENTDHYNLRIKAGFPKNSVGSVTVTLTRLGSTFWKIVPDCI